MARRLVGRLVCLFRGHRWQVEFNRETQGTEADCSRCGSHRSTYPGATQAELGRRGPRATVYGPTHMGGAEGGGGADAGGG